MDNYYIYLVPMAGDMDEAVLPCLDGYTIYLNKDLMGEDLIRAYEHAVFHIENGDCYDDTRTASEKEMRAHRLGYYKDGFGA